MYKLYIDNEHNSDATSYYVSILEEAFKEMGEQTRLITNVSEINEDDKVCVITLKSLYKVLKYNGAQKILMWIQGIAPEESWLYPINLLKKIFYYVIFTIMEAVLFKRVDFFFLVSHEMATHYNKKHPGLIKNYFVMPCFNQKLEEDAFTDKKYGQPTFVYAGSLAKWQCFDETVRIFSEIETQLPNSQFTVLTRQNELAERIFKKYSVKNYKIDYVPLDKLQLELSRYKYGFLLRDDIVVNRVATPTKLNSYMASGVIPIYSDVIVDFNRQLAGMNYIIKINDMRDKIDSARTITEFERKTQIMASEVLSEYKEVFNRYYNRQKYINQICEALKSHEWGV